jgi:hypothetical protein
MRKSSLTAAVAAVLSSCGPGVESPSAPSALLPHTPGLALGVGRDDLSGATRGDCVTRKAAEGAAGTSETRYRLTLVDGVASLAAALELAPSVELFGDGLEDVERYSVWLLAEASVAHPVARMRDVALEPEDAALLAADPAAFRTRCGDSFVAGVAMGGMRRGLVRVAVRTDEQRASVSTALAPALGSWTDAATLVAGLEDAGARNAQVVTTAASLPGDGIASTGVDALARWLRDLPPDVDASPQTPIRVLTQAYSELPLAGTARPLDLTPQKQAVAGYVDAFRRRRELLANISYALAHPLEFEPFVASQLRRQSEALTADVAAIRSHALACFEAPAQCPPLSGLGPSSLTLPARRPFGVRRVQPTVVDHCLQDVTITFSEPVDEVSLRARLAVQPHAFPNFANRAFRILDSDAESPTIRIAFTPSPCAPSTYDTVAVLPGIESRRGARLERPVTTEFSL